MPTFAGPCRWAALLLLPVTSSVWASYAAADEPPAAGLTDVGIFSELDPQVSIRLPTWVPSPASRIHVDKARRLMTVELGGVPLKTYPMALGFTPVGTKLIRGDGKTPLGRYTIVECLHEDLAPRYGARSLRISFPAPHDAKRALRAGRITRAQRDAIAAAARRGTMPPQNTPLGSSIRIHGGGAGEDWTAGCMGLRDPDVIELYPRAPLGTPVLIEATRAGRRGDRDGDGIPDQVDILLGAKKTVLNGAAYGGGYQRLKYPGGDVPRTQGVCTDVVIRALRNAGFDLQVLLKRDIERHPKRYPMVRRKPDPNIDQRRVRTLLPWFKAHWRSHDTAPAPATVMDWLPGDVVLMDTMRGPGPDHIGILSDRLGDSGFPLVINNWTDGAHTAEMDLLGWVPVTHRFRVP